jgi:hypothetical protein
MWHPEVSFDSRTSSSVREKYTSCDATGSKAVHSLRTQVTARDRFPRSAAPHRFPKLLNCIASPLHKKSSYWSISLVQSLQLTLDTVIRISSNMWNHGSVDYKASELMNSERCYWGIMGCSLDPPEPFYQHHDSKGLELALRNSFEAFQTLLTSINCLAYHPRPVALLFYVFILSISPPNAAGYLQLVLNELEERAWHRYSWNIKSVAFRMLLLFRHLGILRTPSTPVQTQMLQRHPQLHWRTN